MADTTSRYGFPYQETTDAPDGPALGQDLVEAVESALGTLEDALEAADTSLDSRLDTAESDINTLETRVTKIDAGQDGIPLVRLTQQSAQNNLTDNTDVAISFGASSEIRDALGWHDTGTNTNRITPNIAGWYWVHGVVWFAARSDYTTLSVGIRRNGSYMDAPVRHGPNATSTVRSLEVSCLVDVNGSGDYIDLAALQDNTANATGSTFINGANRCVLECFYIRPL